MSGNKNINAYILYVLSRIDNTEQSKLYTQKKKAGDFLEFANKNPISITATLLLENKETQYHKDTQEKQHNSNFSIKVTARDGAVVTLENLTRDSTISQIKNEFLAAKNRAFIKNIKEKGFIGKFIFSQKEEILLTRYGTKLREENKALKDYLAPDDLPPIALKEVPSGTLPVAHQELKPELLAQGTIRLIQASGYFKDKDELKLYTHNNSIITFLEFANSHPKSATAQYLQDYGIISRIAEDTNYSFMLKAATTIGVTSIIAAAITVTALLLFSSAGLGLVVCAGIGAALVAGGVAGSICSFYHSKIKSHAPVQKEPQDGDRFYLNIGF